MSDWSFSSVLKLQPVLCLKPADGSTWPKLSDCTPQLIEHAVIAGWCYPSRCSAGKLALLCCSVLCENMENILCWVSLEEKLRLWGENGSQMFPLGIQLVLLSILEWRCKAGFTGSPSKFTAWSGLWNELCKTYCICLFYQKSYWFVILKWACSWALDPCQERTKLCSTRNSVSLNYIYADKKIIWCFIPAMNNARFSFGDSKIALT